MAEILYPDFGGGKNKSEKAAETEQPTGTEKVIDFPFLSGTPEAATASLRRIVDKIREITLFFGELQIVSSGETLAIRADMVAQMKPEEVYSALVNSTENDWKINPTYYRALCNWFLVPGNKMKMLEAFGLGRLP